VSILLYSQGTQLLRQPTLSDDHVVFIYANGSPQRITWHPGADRVEGWTPDGAVVFGSNRMGHPTETFSLYEAQLDGGMPNPLNVTRAAYGEVSMDGKFVAYTPINSWDPEWRNYRGGQAMPIWIQNLETGKTQMTPRLDGERHLYPVWIGQKVYYLSERDYVSNIWSFDTQTQEEEQITFYKTFDVKSLDAHGQDIVYEQGGYLHIINADTKAKNQLNITVKGDMNFARERWESVPANRLINASISPSGKRAIFEHRGEVLTVPKKNGSSRNLTNSSGVADRSPIWSPKGDRVAWFSDGEGEYELIIADQYGAIEKSIAIPSGTFYYRPDWSADGEKIVFTDTHYTIWYVDLKTVP